MKDKLNDINNSDESEEKQLHNQRVVNLVAQKTGRRTLMLLKKKEREVYRRLLFVLILVVFLISFLLIFGLQILVKVAEFLDLVRNTGRPAPTVRDTIPPYPPRIDTLPTATNSARLAISGSAESNSIVEIFVNDNLADKTTAETSNVFKFDRISLKEGENRIKVISTDRAGNQSQLSQTTIIYDKTPPFLEASQPQNNTSYSGQANEIKVQGKTELEATVTINNSLAIVNFEGEFNFNLPITSGENKIKIESTDSAGNKSVISRTVFYSP